MTYESFYDEEIFADFDQAFQKQLTAGKLRFLDDLKRMIVSDSMLLKEFKCSITASFKLMEQFIGNNYDQIDTISLKDWEMFGIKHPDVIYRIGYLSVHYQEDPITTISESDDDFLLQPTFDTMEDSFQNGIREGGVIYLRQLCELCATDFELEGEMSLVTKAFSDMIIFIKGEHTSTNESTGIISQNIIHLEASLGLGDWEQFGLTRDLVQRVGYLAYCMAENAKSCHPE
jgi:hypothetical protein